MYTLMQCNTTALPWIQRTNTWFVWILRLIGKDVTAENLWELRKILDIYWIHIFIYEEKFSTCVFGVSFASTVASAIVIAGCHHHAVGTITVEVREGAHRCRVVTQDNLWTVHSPSLVQHCPPWGRPCDLQSVSADHGDHYILGTTGHWKTQVTLK